MRRAVVLTKLSVVCALSLSVAATVAGSAFAEPTVTPAVPVASTGGAASEEPAIFQRTPYDQVVSDAKSRKKLLLIDFTATWCGPCKMMDKTTWVDSAVEKWVHENAVATQIDVDAQKELAQKFHIEAMPTVLVFAAGSYDKELDRSVGYKKPDELLDWLKGAKEGKTELSILESNGSAVLGRGGEKEVDYRYKLGQNLLKAAKYDEAMEQFCWLWHNIMKEYPPMVGVRGSFMVASMQTAAKHSDAARAKLDELRSESEKNKEWMDWISLNDAVGKKEETLKWFDRVKDDPAYSSALSRASFQLEPLLVKANRIADVTKYVYKDPDKFLAQERMFNQATEEMKKQPNGEAMVAQIKAYRTKNLETKGAIIYASLLLNKRDNDAEKFADDCFKLSDSNDLRFALIRRAMQENQQRPVQIAWLKEMKASHENEVEFLKDRQELYRGMKQFDLATADLNKALELKKDDPELFHERGRLELEQDKFTDALADFNRSIDIKPNASGYTARGFVYFMLKKDDAALADCDQIEKLDPKDPFAYTGRSAVFYRQKKYSQAKAACDKALSVAPKFTVANSLRGTAEYRLGDFDAAIADLTEGLATPPRERGQALYYRALCYDAQKKPELAERDRAMLKEMGGFDPIKEGVEESR